MFSCLVQLPQNRMLPEKVQSSRGRISHFCDILMLLTTLCQFWRRMRSPVAVVIVALLFLPAVARAECPVSSIPGATTARLDRSAVSVMQTLLIAEMPTVIPFIYSESLDLLDAGARHTGRCLQ